MRSIRLQRGLQHGSQAGSQHVSAQPHDGSAEPQVGSQHAGAPQVGSQQVGSQHVGAQLLGRHIRALIRSSRLGLQKGLQQLTGAPQDGSAPQQAALALVAMAAYARPTTINIGKKTRLFMGGLLVPER